MHFNFKEFLMVRTTVLTILTALLFQSCTIADANSCKNNIPPRLQWVNNNGYCGEVSLISAGLYYGQYISQYDIRAIAGKNAPQNKTQLLIGGNDSYAATQLHLNSIEWDTDDEEDTDDFLAWVKQNVAKGYPVAIGVYMNQYLFHDNPDPTAGDSDYDHIVPVIGIDSNYPLTDPNYYSDDVLHFSDNGVWMSDNPPYLFSYGFDEFQASRKDANAKDGEIYSVSDDASNYGIAITGVMDLNGDTLPVRISTNYNFETPDIANGSKRPLPTPLVLTITISGLQPNVVYNLYRYNTIDSVPNSNFNASKALEHWQFTASGSTHVMIERINSNEIAIYRAVKATAP